jgi:hypothetical protein
MITISIITGTSYATIIIASIIIIVITIIIIVRSLAPNATAESLGERVKGEAKRTVKRK